MPVISSPPVPPLSGILDNHYRGRVGEFLRDKICPGSDLSIVSAYFTIYAYEALRNELNCIDRLRFLFGEPSFLRSLDPEKTQRKAFQMTENGLVLANKLAQKRIARECADWIREKVEIRTVVREGFLHGKLYHIANGPVEEAVIGSSNFTVRGLGLAAEGNNIELNLEVDSSRDRADLKRWFDELWMDESLVRDVKSDVIAYLEKIYENHSPEFIYYLTLFHIFREFLDGEKGVDEALRQTTLLETKIWNRLFAFQKDGVKGAINRILAYNGCILADSVGLGKTYEALAVIKYFELRNERVLVLCPKKLMRNWTVFRSPERLNPFDEDRFRYDVFAHTDLSRESGIVNGAELANVNWGNYDLVVIDESHNFRNNAVGTPKQDGSPRRTRYERLMEDLISSGVRTKVLLLSATPVNNQLADLRNQISFIAGGDVARRPEPDAAFAEKLGVHSVKETTRLAQQRFTHWAKEPPANRKTRDLIASLGSDFFNLLDGLSIARSRRQIKRHYQKEMERLGGFPERGNNGRPDSIFPEIDTEKKFLSFEQLDQEISALKLSLYHPTAFLRQDLSALIRAAYDAKIGNFNQEGRERILIAMMKVNFLKRLESSVDSFRLTLQRTIDKIDQLEKRIAAFEKHREESEVDYESLAPSDFEDPEDGEEEFLIGGKHRIHLAHLRIEEWLKAVRHDRVQLQYLLEKTEPIGPERDAKLRALRERIGGKVNNPTITRDGRQNRKVLIFTAFADTAMYLYENLLPWVEELNRCGKGGPPLGLKDQGQAAPATLFQPFEKDADVHRTRQNLPHWTQPGCSYFVTYRLADSIAQSTILPWREELAIWRKNHPEPWDTQAIAEYNRFFVRKEEWLDAGHGSCVLARPEIRSIIEENLIRFHGERYILDEFVIMPNHVHVIVKPLGEYGLSEILHTWKSYTSKQILKLTGRKAPLWMDESFDHIIRSWEQLERFRRYIRENPRSRELQSGRGGSPLCLLDQGQAAPATKPLHIALVQGTGDNKTTLGKSDYEHILTNFSPIAKQRSEQPNFPQAEEIDILIATDCISEGQNLQDCDLLINYDIHWNPVRIIQRFGRIDRIGSRNIEVNLINFWPTKDLDRYLNVKHRVEARMALVDLTASGEDNLLEPNQIEELIETDMRYRDRQLKRLKDEILDLEDLTEDTVSLTDFSLDDFRLDLLRFLESNRALLESAELGLYAVASPIAEKIPCKPGVIFCLKMTKVAGAARPGFAETQGQAAPATHPHFLVYVHDDGSVRFTFAQPKQSLELFQALCAGQSSANEALCDLFDRDTKDGADMSHYSTLLQKAIRSIADTFRKRTAAALQSGRSGLIAPKSEQPEDDGDFELVTWLVIKGIA
jgi:REP element-mobilizing transposase RayT